MSLVWLAFSDAIDRTKPRVTIFQGERGLTSFERCLVYEIEQLCDARGVVVVELERLNDGSLASERGALARAAWNMAFEDEVCGSAVLVDRGKGRGRTWFSFDEVFRAGVDATIGESLQHEFFGG